ncbi:hypothetical protein LIER_42910 [Lithospermum erythrorhizon]|uniref:RNase H type-1 domain-containing protein n=1 Tax=Lithospermum erythrorhizon TaxID=34254 RepID=A0AAV3P4F7_LITER
MSFLVWRILKSWLPIDSLLHRKGIHFASKCQCCRNVESLNHVFLTNQIAIQVWDHYARIFGIRKQIFTHIHLVFKAWSLTVSDKGHIRRLIPVLILWSLWVARNKAKHGEQRYSFHGIVQRINRCLAITIPSGIMQFKHWKGDLGVAALFNVQPLKPRPRKPMKLLWINPPSGHYKLNIDGAFKDAWGGLGGIIRDAQGCIVMVVAFCLPASSALDSELLAAYHIIDWCVIRGFTDLRVETDSLLLSQMLHTGKAHWLRQNMVVQVNSFLQVSRSELTHIWREQNQAADYVS